MAGFGCPPRLEIYDEMTEAEQSGRSYETRLAPPPADARVAHSPRVIPLELGAIPTVIPALPAGEEAAILIWAIVHASGGAVRRTDLARGFALRSQPDLLRRLAPVTLSATVDKWARAVGQRTVVPGLLAATLKELSARDGVDMATDAESHSIVRANANTGVNEQIDPWYRFEAGLVVQVLRSLAAGSVGVIDASVTGGDRALLEAAS